MTSYLETTRASYNTVASNYHKIVREMLTASPFNTAALDLFAELLPDREGSIGDLGCGTGVVTEYLTALGLDVFGIDLSPGMLEVARTEYPDLRFETGSLLDLDLPDGELAGALAWYSLVHTPPEDLPKVFGEIYRVLAPGGILLHGFKVGTGTYHLDEAYGHPLSLDVYRYQPGDVNSLLTEVGFAEVATLISAKRENEKQPQAYLLVRKPL
jgi:SAM-dependent methyltransferase